MAKLYWRVKLKNGKWTWRPAAMYNDDPNEDKSLILVYAMEENE